MARYDRDVICGDHNFLVPDAGGLAFGVLSSSMFIAWMRAVGGRIKSDLRFSATFTYNTFPLPDLSATARAAIAEAARTIVAARTAHPGMALADLYDPGRSPADLRAAHDRVDAAVDALFGGAPRRHPRGPATGTVPRLRPAHPDMTG